MTRQHRLPKEREYLFLSRYLAGKQFSGISEEVMRKSRSGVSMRECMLYSPERRKEQRGMNRATESRGIIKNREQNV